MDDAYDNCADDPATPRRTSSKERELTRIRDRFSHFTKEYASSGFEEDELVERVNEALGDFIELVKSPEGRD